MTEAAAVGTEYVLNDEGYVELGDLERDWFFLEEMRKQVAVLEAGIKRAEAMFAKRMRDAGADGFMINGVPRVMYKQNATFPAKKYAEANPEVAETYTVLKPVFDLDLFKQHRPEEYKQWRGFSFKYVQTARRG